MSEPIILLLPLPPSANRIWRNNRLSPEYRAWKETAGWEAKSQLVGIPMIRGAFSVTIELPPGRKDLDNQAKPLLDLCQAVGAIKNDKHLAELHMYLIERDGALVQIRAL